MLNTNLRVHWRDIQEAGNDFLIQPAGQECITIKTGIVAIVLSIENLRALLIPKPDRTAEERIYG